MELAPPSTVPLVGEAVSQGLLADYKVMVLAVDEKSVTKTFQSQLADENNELNLDDVVKIVDLQVKEIRDRLKSYDVSLVVDESARFWLADQGYDPLFGARPLKRALQKYVESKLAIRLLEGDFKAGDIVHVSKVDGETELSFTAEAKVQAEDSADEQVQG